jgi:hypothetical protein
MSVHPDFAKRYNQSRDIDKAAIRSEHHILGKADRDRLFAVARDLRASADLVKSGGYLIATIFWPEDAERGSEVYGPFVDEVARADWVKEVRAAAEAGDPLLTGVSFVLDQVDFPFKVQQ